LIPVICWKMKNTLTTISARRTPGVQARRRDSRLLPSLAEEEHAATKSQA
jgi:hypothetical protein